MKLSSLISGISSKCKYESINFKITSNIAKNHKIAVARKRVSKKLSFKYKGIIKKDIPDKNIDMIPDKYFILRLLAIKLVKIKDIPEKSNPMEKEKNIAFKRGSMSLDLNKNKKTNKDKTIKKTKLIRKENVYFSFML